MSIALRIGFLGAGKMATALAKGWIGADLTSPEQIVASDPYEQARESFTKETDAKAVRDNAEVLTNSDVVVIAVKPQMMIGLLEGIRSRVTAKHLVISIAAGIRLHQLQQGLYEACRLIRVMPNTPCLVGASAAGYCPGAAATENDVALVDRLMNAVGRAVRVSEPLLDAVTGLSGSGPAFVAIMIEGLTDGGVRMGLPRDVAQTLAAQTVMGTAKMILETGLHPAELKDMVSSPGGTTITGLHELEKGGARGLMIEAVKAATLRAQELGKAEQF